jgi:hypothetical protein
MFFERALQWFSDYGCPSRRRGRLKISLLENLPISRVFAISLFLIY